MAPSATSIAKDESKAQFSVPDFQSFRERYQWPEADESGYQIAEQLCCTERPLRVIAVGGGISGVNIAKIIPQELNNVSLTIYEKNPELGGTWYENRYPGVKCDIPSHSYQFSWAKNPDWKEFYSSGEEILDYVLRVVETYDLRKYFLVNHQVIGASWQEEKGVWDVKVKDLLSGREFVDSAEIFINNEGLLNNWRWPKIEGLHSFEGLLCHTAVYDRATNLDGKRVVVIGIGSSGLQVVPTIASRVAHLYTFIRSPTWVTPGFAQKYSGPGGTNFEYTQEQKDAFRTDHAKYQEYMKGIENELNIRFRYILTNTPEAAEAKKFSLGNMKSKLGGRTDLEDAIIPKDFGLGCRRPTPGSGFLESLTRPNVTTYTQGLSRITQKGFIDPDGKEVEVDVIICATGFDTSFTPRFPIVAGGQNLQDVRKKELLSYISLATPDVPNYFGICGPYGPFAHGSFLTVSELMTRNITTVIRKMQKELIKSVTPKREVCEAFAKHADLFVQRTAWVGPCSSWFKNGDVNGKLSVFPGSRLVYWELLSEPRFEDYHIKYLGGNEFQWLGNGFHLKEFTGTDNSHYLGAINDSITMLPRGQADISSRTPPAVQ